MGTPILIQILWLSRSLLIVPQLTAGDPWCNPAGGSQACFIISSKVICSARSPAAWMNFYGAGSLRLQTFALDPVSAVKITIIIIALHFYMP